MDFAQWRADVLDGTGQSAETHWLALDGERPVGTTFLRMLGPDAAENDYTGVLPSHRNRGIAAVLKGQAIRWAQRNGVTWFYTASSVQNGPMIAVHHRLGYQAGPRQLEVVRDLKLDPET